MLTHEEALPLARRYLADCGPPPAGYRRVLPKGRRVKDGWFFDFASVKIGPAAPGDGFGGAPGVLVGDDGVVTVIGWGRMREINSEEAKRDSGTE